MAVRPIAAAARYTDYASISGTEKTLLAIAIGSMVVFELSALARPDSQRLPLLRRHAGQAKKARELIRAFERLRAVCAEEGFLPTTTMPP